MPELTIDEVHRYLETADSARRRIDATRGESIDIVDLPELIDLAYGIDGPIGINSSLLNRIRQIRGRIRKRDAFKIADRYRIFLKSQDQAFAKQVRTQRPKRQTKPTLSTKPHASSSRAILAERWVVLGSSGDLKVKIGAIASLLDGIIHQINHSNAPPDHQVLSEIERKQLIVILETALNVLRSPMIETGLLKKASSALKSAAKSAVERKLQEGLGSVMHNASERILELLRGLGLPI
ncbi:MAG TPA: hypothetical protein VFB29_02180 [Pseudolabrys sp.]|nr:hypothetical protein [Pseudolabrys sp.]